MRVLVWQWGRRGAGPQVAAAMARWLSEVPGIEVAMSLATGAELLALPDAPVNDLPVHTYSGMRGFVSRLVTAPALAASVGVAVQALRVDVALCAMPAPLDFVMAAALRRAGVPFAVVVHDAQRHPGDIFPLQMVLQRLLLRRAAALIGLTSHVVGQIRARGLRKGQALLLASHPPFVFGPPPPPAGAHGGPLRLLSFGRLLAYKGLDLLADALTLLGNRADIEVRVVGLGPESAELDRLRRLPNVTVENRWAAEAELPGLLAWADALVLSYREASQSGVAAAALAARRWVVGTRVGGLIEQLQDQDMAILCAPDGAAIAAAIATLPGRPPPPGAADTDWRPMAERIAAALHDLVSR